MLPLRSIYVWQYGMGTEVVVITLQGLLQMPEVSLSHHPQQPHHLEVTLAQKDHLSEVALKPPIPPVTQISLAHK